MGGDIEVFSGGGKVLGGKVQSPESRVQSPGSSQGPVQGPVQLLGYAALCLPGGSDKWLPFCRYCRVFCGPV